MVDTNEMIQTSRIEKSKNIIYVDASSLKGRYKIGLYDKTNKIKHTLELGQSVGYIGEAELCAVLYGLMYIQKSNNPNRHILMNDCEAAVSNKKLVEIGQELNTKLIWIPREINKADKVAKGKINKKKKVWRDLNFFMKIALGGAILVRPKQKMITETIIKPLTPMSKIILEEVLSKKNLFPINITDFTPLVLKAASKAKITLIKGDIQKIRKELAFNDFITIKDNVISLR